ncbi:DedA family protein [Mycobacterium sp.]|uniref:DedA family protein n=1 Tax=Mycobacterium sp. TaxID=1785 RepID=UPI002C02C6D8|nr:DedA family protein [Mycobacterium sp.]HTQ16804.1 DedA family protein [Mycobacterium sp.]
MQHFIVSYGLFAIFVLMAAESACLPVPSEVTMLLGGAISTGAVAGSHPTLAAVIISGTLGNVAGSYLAWWAGRRWGQSALRRWGRYAWLRPRDVERAQRWFLRRGTSSVFWARLLPAIRTFISLPAGIAQMPPIRFGLYTVAGCLPWTGALAVAGYVVGANWRSLEEAMRGPSYVVAVACLAGGAALVYLAAHRNRMNDEILSGTDISDRMLSKR